MEELIDREYGGISLQSTYVAELVNTAITEARDAVSKATAATTEALEAADRGLDERTSAFIAWQETHGVNFNDSGGEVKVKLGSIEADTIGKAYQKAREKLREGLQLWEDMNRDPAEFRCGRWNATAELPTDTSRLRSVDDDSSQVKGVGDEIWRTLNTD